MGSRPKLGKINGFQIRINEIIGFRNQIHGNLCNLLVCGPKLMEINESYWFPDKTLWKLGMVSRPQIMEINEHY